MVENIIKIILDTRRIIILHVIPHEKCKEFIKAWRGKHAINSKFDSTIRDLLTEAPYNDLIIFDKNNPDVADICLKQLHGKSLVNAPKEVIVKIRHRSGLVANIVKKRAKGVCQLCGQKAPFENKLGEPYLECHHIEWLSMGGEDSFGNAVALCPNCHKKMHVLNFEEDVEILKKKLQVL